MKVLQIIPGSFAARFLAQHLTVLAAFTTAMNVRQILEEQARSLEQYRQGTIMIRGQGINSGLDVGEVLQKQGGHVRVKTPAVGHRRIRRGPRSRALADLS